MQVTFRFVAPILSFYETYDKCNSTFSSNFFFQLSILARQLCLNTNMSRTIMQLETADNMPLDWNDNKQPHFINFTYSKVRSNQMTLEWKCIKW